MKIGNFEVGSAPLLIAEIGINHNGSIRRAEQMIDAVAATGCQIAKFQTFKADQFCRKDDPLYDTFKRCELPDDAWPMLKTHCDKRGVMFMSTPQNYSDLELLLPLGIPAIKVGSDDACNWDLLDKYAGTRLPLIVSTGMMGGADLAYLVTHYGHYIAALMVCTSQYPCPPEEAQVARVKRLAAHHWIRAGLSDHTTATNTAACMAVAYGACVFECHFTLDHGLPGPDHEWARNEQELQSWANAIREAWVMRGSDAFELTEREAEQKRKYQRKSGQQLRGEQ